MNIGGYIRVIYCSFDTYSGWQIPDFLNFPAKNLKSRRTFPGTGILEFWKFPRIGIWNLGSYKFIGG